VKDEIILPQDAISKKTGCPVIKDKKMIKEIYFKLLFDESRLSPDSIEKIYLPRNTEETASALKEISRNKEKVTVSSSRTGIVGGSVPKKSECLLSLENLELKPEIIFDRKNKSYSVKTGAQLKLNELQDFINKNNKNPKKDFPGNLYYPVDPTETNASVGGMVSTNASGARTFYYGPTRDWEIGRAHV
jgi:FAD/FMN-containing dehydrogenase